MYFWEKKDIAFVTTCSETTGMKNGCVGHSVNIQLRVGGPGAWECDPAPQPTQLPAGEEAQTAYLSCGQQSLSLFQEENPTSPGLIIT